MAPKFSSPAQFTSFDGVALGNAREWRMHPDVPANDDTPSRPQQVFAYVLMAMSGAVIGLVAGAMLF